MSSAHPTHVAALALALVAIAVGPLRARGDATRLELALPADETATPSTATPSATATMTATLPDLLILGVGWGPDLPVATCALYSVPWFVRVTIANQGAAAAGPFGVRAPNATWEVVGLGAGESRVLVGLPSVYPRLPVVVDPDNTVAESDETNNTYDPDPNHLLTSTPVATQPPTCTPTPTATPPIPNVLLPWAARQP